MKQIGIANAAKTLEVVPELSFLTGAVGFDGAFAITLKFSFSQCYIIC